MSQWSEKHFVVCFAYSAFVACRSLKGDKDFLPSKRLKTKENRFPVGQCGKKVFFFVVSLVTIREMESDKYPKKSKNCFFFLFWLVPPKTIWLRGERPKNRLTRKGQKSRPDFFPFPDSRVWYFFAFCAIQFDTSEENLFVFLVNEGTYTIGRGTRLFWSSAKTGLTSFRHSSLVKPEYATWALTETGRVNGWPLYIVYLRQIAWFPSRSVSSWRWWVNYARWKRLGSDYRLCCGFTPADCKKSLSAALSRKKKRRQH